MSILESASLSTVIEMFSIIPLKVSLVVQLTYMH